MNQPHLAIGQEVAFVGRDSKIIKGTISHVYGAHSAHIIWQNGSAVADYSDDKSPGTFHFEQASPKAESLK